MGKKLAIEHHLIRPNEVIELLKMMGGKNKDNADGCSFLYYTLCTPKINNPNNDKVICGFTNLKMQNDHFAIFTLEKFWEKYPYKLNDLVLCDDGLLGVVTKMEWDCEKSDMKYHISFKIPVDNKWYSSKNIKCKFMEAKSKKLAIKGHPTRGNEVIELLKMMGGKNINVTGGDVKGVYLISTEGTIETHYTYYKRPENYVVFTLEEFLEKYPFKIGNEVIDKVDGCPGIVDEMKWDESLSDMIYCVSFGNGIDFGWYANDSIEFYKKNENLEETQSKRDVDNLEKTPVKNHKMGPKSKLPSKYYEDRLEEIKSKREYEELDDNENKFPSFEPMFKMNDELEYKIPDVYEITEVSKDKVFIKPIKSKYPKTYGECCEVLVGRKPKPNEISFDKMELCLVELNNSQNIDFQNPYLSQLNSLFRLRMCRDAYWKIAGEDMGLGKPWEPDCTTPENYYYILNKRGIIVSEFCMNYNHILVFPTEKVRDVFYENFKYLIEDCKELL